MERFLEKVNEIKGLFGTFRQCRNQQPLYRGNIGWLIGTIQKIEITSNRRRRNHLTFSFNGVREVFQSDDISVCWRECLDCGIQLPCRDIYEHYQRNHNSEVGIIKERYGLRFRECSICHVRSLNSLYYIHLNDAHPEVPIPSFQEIINLPRNE